MQVQEKTHLVSPRAAIYHRTVFTPEKAFYIQSHHLASTCISVSALTDKAVIQSEHPFVYARTLAQDLPPSILLQKEDWYANKYVVSDFNGNFLATWEHPFWSFGPARFIFPAELEYHAVSIRPLAWFRHTNSFVWNCAQHTWRREEKHNSNRLSLHRHVSGETNVVARFEQQWIPCDGQMCGVLLVDSKQMNELLIEEDEAALFDPEVDDGYHRVVIRSSDPRNTRVLKSGAAALDIEFHNSPNILNMLLTTVIALLVSVNAHTWVEQLSVVQDGFFAGQSGYPRGYVGRSQQGFSDVSMTYLLPSSDSGRIRINSTDLVCSPLQRYADQTTGFPRLAASPGSIVAFKYLENGHVTLPQNTPGKPLLGGKVFVFGTTQPSPTERLVDILQWPISANTPGRLLAIQNFDDGRCYQINNGAISTSRRQEFPNPIPGVPGSEHEQWCETDVQLPSDLDIGLTYTVYWIWQWPTGNEKHGKDEYYTTCSDIEIVAQIPAGNGISPIPQDPQKRAVANYQRRASLGNAIQTI